MYEASILSAEQSLKPGTYKGKLTADPTDEAIKASPLMNYIQRP